MEPAPQPAAPHETVARFTLALPEGYQVADRAPALAFAPDSSAVAFVAARPGESPKLFVRSLADAVSRELAGTEGAEAPFFSPDARMLAYFAGGRPLRIAIAGGEPVPLADAPAPGGGVWADDGIVFAARWGEGLSRVPEAGGPAQGGDHPRFRQRGRTPRLAARRRDRAGAVRKRPR